MDDEDDDDVDFHPSPTHPALATPRASAAGGPGGTFQPWPFISESQVQPLVWSAHASQYIMGNQQDRNPASALPHEILLQILRYLPPSSLAPSLLVCKSWCQCGVELLWHKPQFPNLFALSRMLAVLGSEESTFPYASYIRRLNFTSLNSEISDKTLLRFQECTRLERLTLAECSTLSSDAIVRMLHSAGSQLVALDMSEVKNVDDAVLEEVGRTCHRLQGLNLSGCSKVTTKGVEAIAMGCPSLRRVHSLVC